MARKRHTPRRESVKRSPLFQGDEMLSFDDPADREELKTLTTEQKMDKFMSKYMILVDPFATYAESLEHARKTPAHVMLDIKRGYKTFVLEEQWTEQKYVQIVDSLMHGGADVNEYTLRSHGFMHDRGNTPPPQRRARRPRRVRKPGK